MKKIFTKQSGKIFLLIALLFSFANSFGATPVTMAQQWALTYTEAFTDIANTTNWAITFGTGSVAATRWGSVPVNVTGTIGDGVKITNATTSFVSGTSAGVQRGTANLQLLSTGTAVSIAVDLFVDFSTVNVGTISFDAATVFNGLGNRNSILKLFYSTNGTTFTEITGANLPLTATNNVANSAAISVAIPSILNGVSSVRFRFYEYSTTGFVGASASGSQPKISIDNVKVTATSNTSPFIKLGNFTQSSRSLNFTTTEGTASATQTDTVSGTNIPVSGIVITAPTGYEISLSSGSGFLSTLTLTPTSGTVASTVVYVRLTAATTVVGSPYNGTITHTSTGAISQSLAVSGTINSPSPFISVGTLTPAGNYPNTFVGTPSSAKTFTLSATNLTAPLTVSALSGYEYSDDGFVTVAQSSLTYNTANVTKTISVRLTGTSAGTNPGGNITVTSSGATNSPATVIVPGGIVYPALTLTEEIVPQYMSGTNISTSSQHLPYIYRITVSGLTPNATYRYYNGMYLSNESNGINTSTNASATPAGFPYFIGNLTTTSGGTDVSGNLITSQNVSPAGGASLNTNGTYGLFTANGSGSFTGWFGIVASNNATHYPPGTINYPTLVLNDGNNGTTNIYFLKTTSSVKVINSVVTTGIGANIWSQSSGTARNLVFLYDNTGATGRPISGTVLESDGTAITNGSQVPAFYTTNVDGKNARWGTIIPTALSNGIQAIEQRKLSDGTVAGCPSTDADGVWPTGPVNTVNPTPGSVLVIAQADARLTCTGGVPVNIAVNTNTASEAAGTVVTVTATATGAVTGDQTFDIVVSGTGITSTDYTLSPSNGTIIILDGATTGNSVTFTVLNDVFNEGTEIANLSMTNLSGGIDFGTNFSENITIEDNDDTISFTALGTAVTENFNTLENSNASGTNLPRGTYFLEQGTSANTTYGFDNGSSSTGNTFSYGASGATERAFGSLNSGTLNPVYLGFQLKNNTGTFVNKLVISYTGEEWRDGATSPADSLAFEYSLDATSINSLGATWTRVNTLTFHAPVEGSTIGIALDGNVAPNRTSVSGNFTFPTDLANGSKMWIRWTDKDVTGSDDGLAIDDLSISPSFQCPTAQITGSNDVCIGSSADLSVAFTSTPPFTFTYTANGVTQTSITTSDNPYTLNVTPSVTTTYAVTTVSNNGCSNVPVTSNAVITVTNQPQAGVASPVPVLTPARTDKVICSGTTTQLNVSGSPTGIQWEQSSTGTSGWANVTGGTGATTNTYTTPSLITTTYFRVKRTTSCYIIYSNNIAIYITAPPAITILPRNDLQPVKGLTDVSAVVSWTPFSYSNTTRLIWNQGGANTTVTFGGSSTNVMPYTITGLTPNTVLNVTVNIPITGCTTQSSTASARTLCAKPTLVLSNATGSSFVATVSGGTLPYTLYYKRTDLNNGYVSKVMTTTTDTIRYLYTCAPYRAYAVYGSCPGNVNLISARSNEQYIQTLCNPNPCPGTPTVALGTPQCANNIPLTMGATGNYLVYFKRLYPTISSLYAYQALNTSTYNYYIGSAGAGSIWEVFVKNICTGGVSSMPSNILQVEVKSTCPAPENVTISNYTCRGFTVSWPPVSCASGYGYAIYYRRSGSTVFNGLSTLQNAYTYNYLSAGYSYEIYVAAKGCNGSLGASSPILITPTLTTCREEDQTQPVIKIGDNASDIVNVYPNPNNGQFNVDITLASGKEDKVSLQVINVIGQVVYSATPEITNSSVKHSIQLNSTLAEGIYFLRVKVGNDSYVTRVVVTH